MDRDVSPPCSSSRLASACLYLPPAIKYILGVVRSQFTNSWLVINDNGGVVFSVRRVRREAAYLNSHY